MDTRRIEEREHIGFRLVWLNVGLAFFGLSVAIMLKADIGVDPWTVFHAALAKQFHVTFGVATTCVSLILFGFAYKITGVKPGLGTLLNVFVIGPWVDLFTWVLQSLHWNYFPLQALQFLFGVALMGFSTALYIRSRLGAGPRDMLVLGLSDKLGFSIKTTRTSIELIVLGAGFLLSGPVGVGTILFALTVGFFMHHFMRMLGSFPPKLNRNHA